MTVKFTASLAGYEKCEIVEIDPEEIEGLSATQIEQYIERLAQEWREDNVDVWWVEERGVKP